MLERLERASAHARRAGLGRAEPGPTPPPPRCAGNARDPYSYRQPAEPGLLVARPLSLPRLAPGLWDMGHGTWPKEAFVGQDEQQGRTWDTDRERERKRAYRERKKLEAEADLGLAASEHEQGEQAIRDSFGYAASEGRTKVERDQTAARVLGRSFSLTEDEYVAQALEAARLFHDQTSPQATESTKTLADRLERAERYARWRYRGFRAGEVSSL